MHTYASIERASETAVNRNPDFSPAFPVLRFLARYLPGGLETMMMLASLSRDDGARAVAGRWTTLPRRAKDTVEPDDICGALGVATGNFLSAVAGTSFELGIDVGPLLGAELEGEAERFAQRAMTLEGIVEAERSLGLFEPEIDFLSPPTLANALKPRRGASKQIQRGVRVQTAKARAACHRMANARKGWRLSQAQFARLLGTSIRTVRRWDAAQFRPTEQQQLFLGLFRQYIERNGMREFRRRFVREAARYGKRGRPAEDKPQARAVAHKREPNAESLSSGCYRTLQSL